MIQKLLDKSIFGISQQISPVDERGTRRPSFTRSFPSFQPIRRRLHFHSVSMPLHGGDPKATSRDNRPGTASNIAEIRFFLRRTGCEFRRIT
jgi:hypothetical protein